MARPEKHPGMKVAERVWRAIDVPKKVASRFDVLTYENCREQGYCIRGQFPFNKKIWIAFAESRGSDNIIIYISHATQLDSGNVPYNGWNTQKSFECGEHDKAGRFISKKLKAFYEEAA
jgi:hypothetical protein